MKLVERERILQSRLLNENSRGKGMKSFQEIYNQTLAEMLAKRSKALTREKASLADQPPYILKVKSKSPLKTKTRATPPVEAQKSVQNPPKPRVLTDTQKQALEFFNLRGEILDEHSGVSDIKKAFRRLAKRLHPDKAPDINPETLRIRAQEFQQLHLAYRLLIDNPL